MATYQTNDGEWTVGDSNPIEVKDERDDLPIFVHSELDDAPISSDAFRVYAHLARRRNKNNGAAWPSYKSMGEKCFGNMAIKPESMRRRVIRAIGELERFNLVVVEKRVLSSGGDATNFYRLTSRKEWKFDGDNAKGGVTVDHPPSDSGSPRSDRKSPKGSTSEGTSEEGTTTSPLSLFAQPVDDLQSPLTTSVRSRKREPKPRGNNVAPPDSSHAEMFAALADLCKVDPNLVNGQLGAQVKRLRNAGYTVADLQRFSAWWYANDFRGKRGEPPALGVVMTDLPRSVAPPPLPVAPPDNQPHVDSLRSWHRTQQNAAWSSHIAAQRGTYPSDAKGYLEWYEEEYGSLGEDELRRLWREYKQEQESE